MLKDELAYSPAVGKSVIAALQRHGAGGRRLLPRGHARPGATAPPRRRSGRIRPASPPQLAKFQEAAAAASAASGRDGPADKAAFAAAMTPVLDTCKTCHEGFRIEN